MLGKNYPTDPQEDSEGGIEVSEGQEYEYEESLPDYQIEDSIDINELIDHQNIAEILDEETLTKLAMDVIQTYEMDKQSRSHREKSMDDAMNMALQISEEKTFPWPDASSVTYPLITESAITFAARAYPAIVRGDKIVMGKVIGSDKGMPQPVIDPRTGQPPVDPNTGQAIIDPATGRPPMQMVGAGEKKQRANRVADYMNYQLMEEIEGWEEDTDKLLTALPITGNMFRKIYYNAELQRAECSLVYPRHLIVNYKAKSLERAPRITEEVELYPHEIIERIRSGTFIDFEFDSASTQDSDLSDRDKSAVLQSDWNNPHLLLQQYRKIDLDGDGYPEPYIVTVHKDKAKVVRIKANYHADGITKNKKNEISKIKCEEYYIKYGFIPSPDGAFYDLGWGELLLSLNKTINATINRLMDAGILANTSQGFLARGVKVKGGESRFRPGEFKTADTRGMPLKDSFVQIQHPEPSMVMFQLLGLLIESAKSLGSLRDVLSGEQVANQSGIAALTILEQGLTGFKSIYKRVYRSIKQELKLLYRVNSLYLGEEHYFTVLDNEQAIARRDFEMEGVDIMPAADPTIVTDMQRMAKAQFLTGFLQDPYMEPKKTREKIFDYVGEDSEGLIVDPPKTEDPNMAFVKVEEAKVENQRLKHQSDNIIAQMTNENKQKDLEIKQLQTQIKATEAQAKIVKANHEISVSELEKQKLAAEVDNIDSATVLNIANAEAAEAGQQLDEYIAKKDSLNDNATGNS